MEIWPYSGEKPLLPSGGSDLPTSTSFHHWTVPAGPAKPRSPVLGKVGRSVLVFGGLSGRSERGSGSVFGGEVEKEEGRVERRSPSSGSKFVKNRRGINVGRVLEGLGGPRNVIEVGEGFRAS